VETELAKTNFLQLKDTNIEERLFSLEVCGRLLTEKFEINSEMIE
jgi:hypothetical protein